VRSGKSNILIVHDRNVAGDVGTRAIERGRDGGGRARCGCHLVRILAERHRAGGRGIVATARSSGANALFMTADTAGALPLLTQLLVDNGIDRARPSSSA
jgi:hypothetical protein